MDVKFDKVLGQRFAGVTKKVEVAVGRPETSNVLWTNKVRSSRYTVLTFLFVNCWEQFHNFANIYFVFVAVLQLIPETSDSNGAPTVLYAFIPVLLITAAKDAYEDWQRHKNDKLANQRKAKKVIRDEPQHSVLNPRNRQVRFAVVDVFWEDLRVGDVIQVARGELIPADAVVLSTTDPSGFTYVETKNLDGESNLKPKTCLKQTQKTMATYSNPIGAWPDGARMTYEGPSTQIYSFTGQIQLGPELIPLSADQLLLRGTSLQGDPALAVIVYTGHMTRVFRNSSVGPTKISRLASWYNKHVAALVVLQLLFVFATAVTYFVTLETETMSWYLGYVSTRTFGTKVKDFFIVCGTLTLLFAFYVPITLLVTLEIIRMVLKVFIQHDKMMKENKDDAAVSVNVSSVIEDLGCISHIFSDKTGTLTQNLMTFSAVALPSPTRVCALLNDQNDFTDDINHNGTAEVTNNLPFCDPAFPTQHLLQLVRSADNAAQCEADLAQLVLVLSLCHTVITREMDDGATALDGPSPDELALVCGAQVFGMRFVGRPLPETINLEFTDDGLRLWNRALKRTDKALEATITVLATLEFDNVRKRMSVIVDIDGTILLLVKGADSSMLPLSRENADTCDDNGVAWIKCHLNELSVVGLRTLVLGIRAISSEEYTAWAHRWNEAHMHSGSTEARDNELQACKCAMECNLHLVGVTGVEDKLQDEVPETIAAVQKAGIKFWVLTGDKVETATNIAKSCSLITASTYTSTFADNNADAIAAQLANVTRFLRAGELRRTEGFNLDWAEDEKKEYVGLVKPKRGMVRNMLKRAARGTNIPTFNVSDVDAYLAARRETLGSLSHGDTPLHRHAQRLDGSRASFESARSLSGLKRPGSIHDVAAHASQMTVSAALGVASGKVSIFDKVSIIVTGECMNTILESTRLRRSFFKLALSSCHSIICCRVTPIQKSLVVIWSQLYLESMQSAMLAIGDGANDVGMILSARVGIGIHGKEGSQASRSADFSIPQFKYIRRLLFVHGREAWRRNTAIIYFFIYKNVAFCMTGLVINVFAQWSGVDPYDVLMKQQFNMMFTGLPVLLFGIFDRQFSIDILHRSSHLYMQSTGSRLELPTAGHSTFAYWFTQALVTATASSLIPLIALASMPAPGPCIEWLGHYIYLSVLFSLSYILVVNSNILYGLTVFIVVGGNVMYFVLWAMLSAWWWPWGNVGADTGSFVLAQSYPTFALGLFLSTAIAVLPHSVYLATINSRLTPARLVAAACKKHARNRKQEIKDGASLSDDIAREDFATAGFDPDELVDKHMMTNVECAAAVVPDAIARQGSSLREPVLVESLADVVRSDSGPPCQDLHAQPLETVVGVDFELGMSSDEGSIPPLMNMRIRDEQVTRL